MLPSEFLETLDIDMGMRTADWLIDQKKSGIAVVLIDFRSQSQFTEGHIEGAVQLSISDLPSKLGGLVPDRESFVLLYCSGSIQSAMAMMYLRTEGYTNSFNLSGGYSSWLRKERPIVSGANG